MSIFDDSSIRECTQERTAVPILKDEKLNHTLQRVIRNTTLAGTYESVSKNHTSAIKANAAIKDMANSVGHGGSTNLGFANNSSLGDNLMNKSQAQTIHNSDFDEEDEMELKDFKHLPKHKMVEATNVLFREKVKELTFPKNPSLFSQEPEKRQTSRNTTSRRNNTSLF